MEGQNRYPSGRGGARRSAAARTPARSWRRRRPLFRATKMRQDKRRNRCTQASRGPRSMQTSTRRRGTRQAPTRCIRRACARSPRRHGAAGANETGVRPFYRPWPGSPPAMGLRVSGQGNIHLLQGGKKNRPDRSQVRTGGQAGERRSCGLASAGRFRQDANKTDSKCEQGRWGDENLRGGDTQWRSR